MRDPNNCENEQEYVAKEQQHGRGDAAPDHATIQYDTLLTRAEIVTIGADLGPTRQVDELQNRAPTCQSRAREQSAFF